MTAKILIDIEEYEKLQATIEERNAYIHEAEVNGKIKCKTVYRYVIQDDKERYGIPFSHFHESPLRMLLSEEQISDIENEDVKKLVKGVAIKVKELDVYVTQAIEDRNTYLIRKENLINMGWFKRLKFLFTGEHYVK